MIEILLATVTADEVGTVITDGKFGYENKNFLTFLDSSNTSSQNLKILDNFSPAFSAVFLSSFVRASKFAFRSLNALSLPVGVFP
jgi:hypothetical protein